MLHSTLRSFKLGPFLNEEISGAGELRLKSGSTLNQINRVLDEFRIPRKDKTLYELLYATCRKQEMMGHDLLRKHKHLGQVDWEMTYEYDMLQSIKEQIREITLCIYEFHDIPKAFDAELQRAFPPEEEDNIFYLPGI